MTTHDARLLAELEIERAQQLNASHEHAESVKRATLAQVILDLCNQLDAVTAAPAPVPAASVPAVDPPKPKAKKG